MKLSNFDKSMAAVAFAEAGEHDTVRELPGEGGKKKRTNIQPQKSKPYMKTLLFGAVSLTAYVLLFKNERLITTTFTTGGWYTLFPVLTAFFFSFIHGAFASNLLSVLGLEAKK